MSLHILNRYVAFHDSGLIHVYSNVPSMRTPSHILSKHVTFRQCEKVHVDTNAPSENAMSHFLQEFSLTRLHFNVDQFMSVQITLL